MPVINVFDFAERIKQYVHDDLGHKNWFVNNILVFYSTRSKQTRYGYKVAPLYVGVIARDTTVGRVLNCRIHFDELCTIVSPNTGNSIPYLNVSTSAKEHRAIFETGVTYLDIECTKIGKYNDRPYVKHHTIRADSKPHFDKLNATVIEKIKERLEIYNTSNMTEMQAQYNELIDDEETDAVNPLRHC